MQVYRTCMLVVSCFILKAFFFFHILLYTYWICLFLPLWLTQWFSPVPDYPGFSPRAFPSLSRVTLSASAMFALCVSLRHTGLISLFSLYITPESFGSPFVFQLAFLQTECDSTNMYYSCCALIQDQTFWDGRCQKEENKDKWQIQCPALMMLGSVLSWQGVWGGFTHDKNMVAWP